MVGCIQYFCTAIHISLRGSLQAMKTLSSWFPACGIQIIVMFLNVILSTQGILYMISSTVCTLLEKSLSSHSPPPFSALLGRGEQGEGGRGGGSDYIHVSGCYFQQTWYSVQKLKKTQLRLQKAFRHNMRWCNVFHTLAILPPSPGVLCFIFSSTWLSAHDRETCICLLIAGPVFTKTRTQGSSTGSRCST